MYRIHMLPAQRGDALLVEYGEEASPHFMLIDGGPYVSYKEGSAEEAAWEAALQRVAASPHGLDLAVVTHVDSDHIQGIIHMLDHPGRVTPADVWFNGWRHLDPTALMSPDEGEFLGGQLVQQGIRWNDAFAGGAIAWQPGQPLPERDLPGGMHLTLLSPSLKTLLALRATWEKEVKKAATVSHRPKTGLAALLGEPGELPVEFFAAQKMGSDSSRANGSSIALLAEFEGKACLFAADAYAKVVETALDGLLAQRGLAVLPLAALKVSHHGSKNNTSPKLLARLDSQRYLISTDGASFGHPDDGGMARILKRTQQQGDERQAEICFNYTTRFNQGVNFPRLKRDYSFETIYAPEDAPGLVLDL